MDEDMKRRHAAIKELIAEQAIEDQKSLVDLLESQFGLATNQAQVSRDLRRLGIGKRKVGNRMVYEAPSLDETRELLRLAVREVAHNETTLVIKTVPGLAPFVAYHIDNTEDIGILATVAGEDALTAVPESCKNIKQIFKAVCKAVYYKT